MSEIRHESDMTKQERRQQAKERIKSQKGFDKVIYIWSYYKPQLFTALGIIVGAIWLIHYLWSLQYHQDMYLAIVNATVCDSEAIAADYRAYIQDDDKFSMIDVDNSLIMGIDDATDMMGDIRFTAFATSTLYDLVLMEEDCYAPYAETDIFISIDEFCQENQLECPNVETLDNEKGIHVNPGVLDQYGIDGIGAGEYGLYICSASKNPEHVLSMISFMQ